MPTALAISFVDSAGALQALELDLFLAEQHTHQAQATEFPIEMGAVFADHVIQRPDQLRLQVLISDSPLPSTVGVEPESFRQQAEAGMYLGRATGTYRQLVEIKESGTPLVVATSVHVYEDMVLEEVGLPVDAGTGDAALVSLAFKRVERVGLRTVAVPKIEKAMPKVSKGRQLPVPATARQDTLARAAAKAAGYNPPGGTP